MMMMMIMIIIIIIIIIINIELKKKLVRRYVWCITLYGSETWTLRKLRAEEFGELRNVVLEENGG